MKKFWLVNEGKDTMKENAPGDPGLMVFIDKKDGLLKLKYCGVVYSFPAP